MVRSRAPWLAAVAVAGITAAAAIAMLRAEQQSSAALKPPPFPIDALSHYKVEFLGVTCGQMTLESRLENRDGRPAYHVVMTARNSKFFNKIYRVDGRIESWVDAETMTTLVYESDITEKGERGIKRYTIDRSRGVVIAEEDGTTEEIPYEGEGGLDPLAYIYRSRVLAGATGTTFSLRLLTDKGAVGTVSRVVEARLMKTFEGRRPLLKIQPETADNEMFSRKGEFVYWVDPGPERTLHLIDFKLGFGRLTAKLTGPADGPVDRRGLTDAEEDD
jgi:hypothetical protein